jgi:hypothetical protein
MQARSLPGGLVVSKRSSRAKSSVGCSSSAPWRGEEVVLIGRSLSDRVLAALFARANSW